MMTLNELLSQLHRWLRDEEGDLYGDDVLIVNLRLALAELQRICPLNLSVAGLDSALTTELDGMEDLLLRLTAWLCVQQRYRVRFDVYHPDQPQAQPIEGRWAEERELLEQMISQCRFLYLQRSTQPPYAIWAEEDGGV